MKYRKREANTGKADGFQPSSVNVHIEELVLHGFAEGDRYHIGEAVERELARLIGERGAPPSLTGRRETDQVDGGSIRLPAGAKPGAIGSQVAGAVYGGLAQ